MHKLKIYVYLLWKLTCSSIVVYLLCAKNNSTVRIGYQNTTELCEIIKKNVKKQYESTASIFFLGMNFNWDVFLEYRIYGIKSDWIPFV